MVYIFLCCQVLTLFLIKFLSLKMLPLKVFIYSWLIATFLHLSPFVVYEFEVNFFVLSLLLLIYFSFIGGCVFSEFRVVNTRRVLLSLSTEKTFLIVMSVIGLLVFLYSIYGAFVAFGGGSGFQSLREDLWENKGFESYSSLDRVINKIKPLIILFLASVPFLWIRLHRKTAFLVMLGAVGVCLDGLSQGGRAYIVILFLDVFFAIVMLKIFEHKSYLLLVKKIKVMRVVLYVSIPFVLYFLVFYLPSQRVETFTAYAAADVLYRMEKGSFTDISIYLAEFFGGGVLVSLLSLQYFMQPLANLSFFVNEVVVYEWYAMGSYNLPILFQESGLEVRKDIAVARVTYGMGPNPWASTVRDILIDFGVYIGTVVAFLYGFFATLVAKLASANSSFLNVGLLGLVLTGISLFPYFNIFHIGPFTMAVMYAIFVYFISILRVNKRC